MAGAAQANIKKPDRYDLALVYSIVPATGGGVFTRNVFQAAPVQLSKKHLAQGRVQGIVANSGCANACTGEQGRADAEEMAATAADVLGCKTEEVLVASTGVIGVNLPMHKINSGIREAGAKLSSVKGHLAAQAIMTTDTFAKEAAFRFALGDKRVTIGGMAKGSGMIHPNMATLLSFITTDAAISAGCLQQALQEAADKSFNMITVDGDTSTNDSPIILANSQAELPHL